MDRSVFRLRTLRYGLSSAAIACLVCVLALFGVSSAWGVPVLDGERDPEYALVAASEADNLRTGDDADPRARSLDVTGLWAANTATDLYVYIDLPYLDLQTIAGEWCLVFHLGGVNDSIARAGRFGDPYGASVDYAHAPAANAVLKSNMRGFLADYDGNQGWAFLNPVNKALNNWDWANGNFLGDAGWTHDESGGTIRGQGTSGAGIVYREERGIEVRIPLARFAGNPGNTNVAPPVMGDTIRMQFYGNVRERTSPLYPRGPIDCVPFESANRLNPSRGTVSRWASYTLNDFSVTGASLRDAIDTGHLVISFSSPVGAGAASPASYSVTDERTGVPIAVTAAQPDPSDDTRVVLALSLPFNAPLRIAVANVRGADGASLQAGTAALHTPPGLAFDLRDPYGAVAALGNDPDTGAPYRLSVTGDMIGWRSDAEGATEVFVEPVPGEVGHYRSAPVFAGPGVVSYKYRVPGLPDWDNWNALNPRNRRWLVPDGTTVVQTSDNAAGTVNGTARHGTRRAVFTLCDADDVARGRPVYLTGEFTAWSGGPAGAIRMLPVAGLPRTYRAELDLPEGFGADTASRYRYIIVPDAGNALWNDLNPLGDRWSHFRAGGEPPMIRVDDTVGGGLFARILRTVAGLQTAPGWSDYFADLDINADGVVTFADAMSLSRPARLPRLRAQGTRVVDETGAEVLFRGINVGGWFVEEMWMTPWVTEPPAGSAYPAVQDHVSLWSVLNQRLGVAATRRVMAAYRDAWIREDDFGRMRRAGFNVVRVPFLYSLVDEPDGMQWLRRAVRDANRAGLYVILDMHGAPGGQSPWDHTGQVGVNAFFSDPANIALAEDVWGRIAREFGAQPGVAAFDLLNEPAGAPSAATLHQVHDRLYRAVRAHAPDTMVIIEDGYKGFHMMPPTSQYGWENVIYSTHLYDFGATSSQDHLNSLNDQLPGILQTRNARNVPLYIGEFNLEPHNAPDAMAAYTDILTRSGCGWSLWTFKTVAPHGPMGFWGYFSNPGAVDALNPFTDSEAALVGKMRQARTENLAVPGGFAGVFQRD